MSGHTTNWQVVCSIADVPENGSACVLVDGAQIAIYNYTRLDKWFATDNRCSHWNENVLSRGLLSSTDNAPKVVCPLHKRAFSLETGECAGGDVEPIQTYAIKIQDGNVLLGHG